MLITVKSIKTKQDLIQAFQIRYKIYCEDSNLLPKEDYPGKMEKDEYDELSTTHSFFVYLQEKLIGTFRIIGSNNKFKNKLFGLPIEDLYELDELKQKNKSLYEISRVAILKEAINNEIFLDIWKSIFQYIIKSNIKGIIVSANMQTSNHDTALSVYNQLKFMNLIHDTIKTRPRDIEVLQQDNNDLNNSKKHDNKLPFVMELLKRIGFTFTGFCSYYKKFGMYTIPAYFDTSKINNIHEPFRTFFFRDFQKDK